MAKKHVISQVDASVVVAEVLGTDGGRLPQEVSTQRSKMRQALRATMAGLRAKMQAELEACESTEEADVCEKEWDEKVATILTEQASLWIGTSL